MEIFRKLLIENSKIVSDGFHQKKKKKYQKMLRELLKDFSFSKKKTFNVLHYCIGTKCLEIEMR